MQTLSRAEWISIHAPHEGERPPRRPVPRAPQRFQSTLPTRGSDAAAKKAAAEKAKFQSTLPTRGSDKVFCRPYPARSGFQSTLPTRGSDCDKKAGGDRPMNFNPRSPRGGATEDKSSLVAAINISIHAPHEGERHRPPILLIEFLPHFNPRSPRGGATRQSASHIHHAHDISIHAPHEGERLYRAYHRRYHADFNPRSPRGGATGK